MKPYNKNIGKLECSMSTNKFKFPSSTLSTKPIKVQLTQWLALFLSIFILEIPPSLPTLPLNLLLYWAGIVKFDGSVYVK